MSQHRLSVIIPTLNEQDQVSLAIESAILFAQGDSPEIIVVDGGSCDDSASRAEAAGARLFATAPGRAVQMNHGVAVSSGTVVLFLHADSQLPVNGWPVLKQALEHQACWGCFRQRIDHPRHFYRWIESGNAARARWMGRVFGDQALWITRQAWDRCGGYPEWPLMEDVEISRRLRKFSWPVLLQAQVTTSPRRWEKNGILRQTLLNWSLQIRHLFGSQPGDLAARYRPHRDENPE